MRDGRLGYPLPRIATALLAAAALGASLTSCGGDSPAATAQTATATREGSVRNRADLARQRPKPVGAGARCQTQVGEFLNAMDALRRNLVAGLSYEQSVGEVKAIRAAYGAIPTGRVALGCLKASGTPGESGFNEYIAASNTWTDCVETAGCESASIEAELQERWRQASAHLSKAQQGLLRLGSG